MTSLATSLHRKDQTKTAVADIIRSGAHFKLQYLEIARRAHERIDAVTLPGWARQYLRGYVDAMLEPLSRAAEFRYLVRGTWINAKDLDYGPGCTARGAECGHSGCYVATQNPPQGTFWPGSDRIFYMSVKDIYGGNLPETSKVETSA